MASAFLTLNNGTREVPDHAWWRPAAEYTIAKSRARIAEINLQIGMIVGFAAGTIIGWIIYKLS